jgi:hypothetical protein
MYTQAHLWYVSSCKANHQVLRAPRHTLERLKQRLTPDWVKHDVNTCGNKAARAAAAAAAAAAQLSASNSTWPPTGSNTTSTPAAPNKQQQQQQQQQP